MRIVFVGTGDIGVPTLESLLHSSDHQLVGVVTQPDKPAGRAQELSPPAIKKALGKNAVPIFQPARIKTEESIAQIRQWNPDVIVVMAYGQILPRPVLDLPSIACLNLHASLLPRHRGAAPIQAAIVAGDHETGITVMYMDEGLDTGDILLQSAIAVAPDETGGSLHQRLAQISPPILIEALRQLQTGNAPRRPQDSADATYAPKLKRDDGQIDWSEPANIIERKIRAFNPWPVAFAILSPKAGPVRKLKIFSATTIDGKEAVPGEVLVTEDHKLVVATGHGALSLNEVQLEGKRRMTAAEFLRGFSSPFRFVPSPQSSVQPES